MKVIFTCGGTAGHVNPALAIAGYMREKDPAAQVLFVGAERGLERDLIAHTEYPFRTVNISSFHRSLKPKEIRHNLISVKNLLHAEKEADAILNDFQPDLIVGTGGYASYPIVRYGAKRGIPTAVHESNIVPGLTTRELEKYALRVMVGFEDCRQHYQHPEKVVVTGTPVRGDFFTRTKQEAKRALGVDDGRPLIVSFWGSLGSGGMNRMMVDFLALEAAHEPFHHIHAVGSISWEAMRGELAERGISLDEHPALDVREYIYNMADVMRAADLVLARAGASTIAELTALGVPALLVPSPNVTNHHQEKNANLLGEHGAALVLAEEGLDGKQLFAAASEILHNEPKRESMERCMASLGVRDATERIYETVMSLAGAAGTNR
ncbi:MAG: UDP-N-acetylglucosamine--N-acetylmuramyl-(pentapeptide) pyrophosphoryl-undecaprenol N-acetylglucosamine transferase [Oscillospiraceae bacterium]|nr:UDP-N-acetylglucosamine--N-acetylmuramyl-(pentapeptide) pyrophosphoryl-undecaprenol N-acetylglucosamine transferase [Oscillospiraceae bacterium]